MEMPSEGDKYRKVVVPCLLRMFSVLEPVAGLLLEKQLRENILPHDYVAWKYEKFKNGLLQEKILLQC